LKPNLLKAIVIDQDNGQVKGRGPYRNIRNVPGAIRNYKKNMKLRFPNALHINFYDHKGIYLFQEKYESAEVDEKKYKSFRHKYLNAMFSITGEHFFYNELIFFQWDP